MQTYTFNAMWSDCSKTVQGCLGFFVVAFVSFSCSSDSQFLCVLACVTSTLHLLFGLQTHWGDDASPLTHLCSTELSRTVFLISVQI